MPVEESYKVIRGRILWFNNHTGYGCIVRGDGKGDCLFHIQEMRSAPQCLREGEEIRFEIASNDLEMKVVNIYRVIQ